MDDLQQSEPSAQPGPSCSLPFPVVGIGASAGGLPALLRLFENMSANNQMAPNKRRWAGLDGRRYAYAWRMSEYLTQASCVTSPACVSS